MARYSTGYPMAMSSLDSRYDYLFENRDVRVVYTIAMKQMNEMTDADRASISTRRYTWRTSDRYWQVAERFYGDPRMWFVIAYYNKAPTEFHLSNGQDILVPSNPRIILEKLGL